MRIALYGIGEDQLDKHKDILRSRLSVVNQQAEIHCYQNEQKLYKDMSNYDVVFLREEALRQFEDYIMYASDRKKITMKAGKELRSFYLDDIYYIEADLNRVHLMTNREENILPIGITETEELLDERFIKVHRSYLVNMDHIDRISNRSVYLDNGKKIAVSKYRLREVKEHVLGRESLEQLQ
ncbi:MAG TPA: hypothetical protein DHV96_13485 [Lachnospiraceae bacterium]|nr:hypothetical protein [Lachnospiraceae bacterium]